MSELSHDPFYSYKSEFDNQQVIDVLVDAIMNDSVMWGDSHIDKISRKWSNPLAYDEYIELTKRYHQGICHYFLSIYDNDSNHFIEGFCLSDSDIGPYAVDENGDESDDVLEEIRDLPAIIRNHLENAPIQTELIIEKASVESAFWRIATSYAISGNESRIYATARMPESDQDAALESIVNDIHNQGYDLDHYTIRAAVTDLANSEHTPKNQL